MIVTSGAQVPHPPELPERRQLFLKGLADDFAALRRDPAAWDEELREREAWDTTLSDVLP